MKATMGGIGILFVALLIGSAAGHLGIRGEHISRDFFIAGEIADKAKDGLIEHLDKFSKDLEHNLTRKLQHFPIYLEVASNASWYFGSATENFLNVAKNESETLLQKLRQVPSSENVTDDIKSELTDYFSEMENFHVTFCGILDETMEFVLDSVDMFRKTFIQFSDAQFGIIEKRKAVKDDWCYNRFNDFLWQSAEEMFQCATGKMRVAYDIYSITKMNTYHVLKMLEYRIQKLYNCFLFGNYQIRCRFMRNAEADFEKLHMRLDELLMYNEKQKRKIYLDLQMGEYVECIPLNFPDGQLSDSLKSCAHVSLNVIQQGESN